MKSLSPRGGKRKRPFSANGQRLGRRKPTEAEEIARVEAAFGTFDFDSEVPFARWPLSERTKRGLAKAHFTQPTDIQRAALAEGLSGRDVVGAAKTGSGKTLAFGLCLVERLWRERWSRADGTAAIVLSPTRELARQTFDVLTRVGCFHDFSGALLVGGTDYEFERRRVGATNVVVSTPGRLLQHMDENAAFSADALLLLVLDEADRMLDMGFRPQLAGILANLPKRRQTLLFSATQTKSVRDLARLSLTDPVYVSVHEKSSTATPDGLRQSFVVAGEAEKLDLLFSFLKAHTHKKVLVFAATCHQVRFYAEALRALGLGMSLGALHGNLAHSRRVDVFEAFGRKASMALLATDLAARGLDFPNVDWVVQLDAPADVSEYIHRSGRTARYKRKGEALLVLSPAQAPVFTQRLADARIPIQEIQVSDAKVEKVGRRLEELLAASPQLRDFAKRAFVAHLRSLHFAPDKSLFQTASVDQAALAASFGLPAPPRLRFLRPKTSAKTSAKAKTSRLDKTEEESGEEEEEDGKRSSKTSSKTTSKTSSKSSSKTKTRLSKAQEDSGDEEPEDLFDCDGAANSDSELMSVKRSNVFAGEEEEGGPGVSAKVKAPSMAKLRERERKLTRRLLREGGKDGQRTVFDEDGGKEAKEEAEPQRYSLEEARRRMEAEDRKDAAAQRARRKEKRKALKAKEKAARRVELGGEPEVGLGQVEEEEAHSDDLGSGAEESDGGEGFQIEEPDFGQKRRRRAEPTEEELALALLEQ